MEMEKLEKEQKNINHPTYYNVGKYEVINVIYNWGLDFDLGNAVKYIARAGHKSSGSLDQKDKTIEDLNKAIWYLEHKRKMIEEKRYPNLVTLVDCYDPQTVVEDWQLPPLLKDAVLYISHINDTTGWKMCLDGAIKNIKVYANALKMTA